MLDFLGRWAIKALSRRALPPAALLRVSSDRAGFKDGSAAASQSGGDVLVETGGFRVDRARAIDKLSRYQLIDPADFLIALLRAAVGSQARTIKIDTLPGGVRLSFDGEPLPESFLLDPFSPLFDEEGQEERLKDAAYSLLAAARLGPRRVAVASGTGAKRRRFCLGEDRGTPLGEAATEFIFEWAGPLGRLAGRHCAKRAAAAFALAGDSNLVINGQPVRSSGQRPEWSLSFSDGAISAWRPALAGEACSITFYVRGAASGRFPLPEASGMVALARVDALTLNASLNVSESDHRVGEVREAVLKRAAWKSPRPRNLMARTGAALLLGSAVLLAGLGVTIARQPQDLTPGDYTTASGKVTSFGFDRSGEEGKDVSLVLILDKARYRFEFSTHQVARNPILATLVPAAALGKTAVIHAARADLRGPPWSTVVPLSLSIDGRQVYGLPEGLADSSHDEHGGGWAIVVLSILFLGIPGLIVLREV